MKEERHVIHPRIVAGTVDADLLQDERLHEQFVRTAAQMPGKVALRCGGRERLGWLCPCGPYHRPGL